MYLKNLQLLGFKTFADKTELHFPDGITCIVGPNGSGKSNISDALRWVLGEQSLKDLRSASLQEVIFNGAQDRKPLGMAQVVLTVDNSDNALPTEFSEVSIARCVYRSGDSEFNINKTPCRLKDIHDLFLGTGLGRDTYSIVGQGQVDLVLSSKPEERRLLFEEAAGVSRIKYRKREALRKLDSASQNLSRILDILNEVESRLEPLQKQSEKARRYLEVKERFKELDLALKKIFINALNEQQLLHDAKISMQQNHILEARERMKAVEDEKAQLASQEQERGREIQKEQGIQADLSSRKNSESEALAVLQERKKSLASSRGYLEAEHQRLESAGMQSQRDIRDMQTKKEQLESQLQEHEARITARAQELENILMKLASENKSLDERNKELIEIFRQIALFHNEKLHCEKILKAHDQEEETLRGEKVPLAQRIEGAGKTLLHAEKELETLAFEEKNLQEYLSALETVLEEVEGNNRRFMDEMNHISSRLLAKQSELSVYENFFRFHSDEALVSSVHPVVPDFGKKLFSCISVREGYERAVEAAIGERLQSFIVQNAENAQKVLAAVKENKTGRAALAILDAINAPDGASFSPAVTEAAGVCGPAVNFVSIEDERFSALALALLGNVLVVENLKALFSLLPKAPSVTLATLDGDVISPYGFIEGGDYNKESFFEMEKFSRQTENDIEALAGEEAVLVKKVHLSGSVLESLKQDCSRAASALQERKDFKNRLEVEIISLKEQERSLNREVEIVDAQMKACAEEKEHYSRQHSTLNEKIHVFENQRNFLETCVRELEIKTVALVAAQNECDDALTGTRMEEVKAREQLSLSLETLEALQAQGGKLDEDLQMTRLKMEELSRVEQEIHLAEEKVQQNIQALDVRLDETGQALSRIQKGRQDVINKISENDGRTKALWEELSRLNESLKEYEIEQTRSIISMEEMDKALQEEYDLTRGALLETECIPVEDEAQAQLSRWRNSLKYMGSVNLEAEKEYEELKERHASLAAQRQDIDASVEKLKEMIRDLDTEARSIFIKTFNEIEKHFTELFTELFGGGEARLILLEGEDIFDVGVDLKVQLPGKAMQPISLLSGGEKSLVAIALLFAILAVNPSPFCVLDEIDAALDESNVGRFADMVKKFSEKTQFIVITHNKGTMKSANVLYGVTMEEPGVSKLISLKLGEVREELLVEK